VIHDKFHGRIFLTIFFGIPGKERRLTRGEFSLFTPNVTQKIEGETKKISRLASCAVLCDFV
jgi:hypothetical protein